MKKSRILVGMLEQVVIEKLEVAKVTKSFVLNGQRLTDVPGVVLEDEWCQQYLQSLYLKNNLIRGVNPRINQLKSLTQLSLENNKLEELPSSINCLTELETLVIVSNRLTHLPETLGDLKNLQRLYASRNQFTSIPNKLWMAPKLTLVDFHDNLIEEVQPEIIYCQSLEMLFLMKNKLHCIPIQITRLPLLNHLIVGSNLLGKFVLGVKSMTSLFQLSLVNNQRLAHIPVDLYMARHHIHNLHLTGCGTESGAETVNPHLLCEIGHVPLLQELSARVLRKSLKANKNLNPLLLWLPKQLAHLLLLPLTLCNWLVPSGACHACGEAFFLYYIQKEGHGQEFLHEILGDNCRTIGDDLNDIQKKNIFFTVYQNDLKINMGVCTYYINIGACNNACACGKDTW